MDRRDFLKKSAMAAMAGAVIASPLGSIAAQDSHNNTKTHSRNMKVLLINGSPRQNGNTHLALTEAAKQLEKNGIATELMQIGHSAIHGCIACNYCSNTGRCVFNDDLCNRAIDLMSQCDALIVGSPTYYGQPNGTVLSLIQRMSYAASGVMQNKPAAAVAVCRRGGASAVYQTLLMPFQMLNMPVVTSQYWNIVYGRTEGEAALDAEGLQTMRTMADNMAFLLTRIHADGNPQYPKREPHQATSFIK
ncbi:MAG: NAD(P)H-dependent oxidoreductase [Bacteroidales bacterium]|nr:NAD(P)H-dependent oxidoreductase [Bacteroidales bacterium]